MSQKYMPRHESNKLGCKSHMVIQSKKDKDRKRHKGENRRNYLREERDAPAFILCVG